MNSNTPEPAGETQTITSFRGQWAFLSNFYPADCDYAGETYPTAEHAFAAAKTTDLEVRKLIQVAATPSEAKRLGRKLALREGWDDMRLEVARQILESKFQNPELQQKLRNTGDTILMEGNTWGDTYWGVCNGVGQNHLGRLLMEIRAEIRAEE